jgi:hypothetical protein
MCAWLDGWRRVDRDRERIVMSDGDESSVAMEHDH